MCVSKCPDKFATYTEMQLQHKLGKSSWEYYRQFCKPGFNNPDKVPVLIHEIHVPRKTSLHLCWWCSPAVNPNSPFLNMRPNKILFFVVFVFYLHKDQRTRKQLHTIILTLLSLLCFFQPVSQVLRDEDCPSMIVPSRPCKDETPLSPTISTNYVRIRIFPHDLGGFFADQNHSNNLSMCSII